MELNFVKCFEKWMNMATFSANFTVIAPQIAKEQTFKYFVLGISVYRIVQKKYSSLKQKILLL